METPQTMTMRGDYVLLRAGGLRLLLPQRDVAATEYIEQTPQASVEPGVFDYRDSAGRRQPLLALSAQMRPLSVFPTERILMTRLNVARGLSFAWDEVRVLIDTELQFHNLPAVIRGEGGPIEAYVEIDGELVLCTTGDRLAPEQRALIEA